MSKRANCEVDINGTKLLKKNNNNKASSQICLDSGCQKKGLYDTKLLISDDKSGTNLSKGCGRELQAKMLLYVFFGLWRRTLDMRQNGRKTRGKSRRVRGGEWLRLHPRCFCVGGTRSRLGQKKVSRMSLKRAFVKNSIFLYKMQHFFMLPSWAFSAALHSLEWEWSLSFRLEDTPGVR